MCNKQVRLLKPIAGFAGYNSEMRELASVISRVLPVVVIQSNYLYLRTFICITLM